MSELHFQAWSASSLGASPSTLYKPVRQVGKGTYGEVYYGLHAISNSPVALKKVSWSHLEEKHKHRGFPLNAVREIRLLKLKCSHPNLVKLLDVAAHIPLAKAATENRKASRPRDEWENEEDEKNGFVYLVFEYVEHDLAGILDAFRVTQSPFTVPMVKCLMKQLLEALVYIHEQSICHRDLKCSNMLITKDFQLKLADFGLAREINYEGVLSPKVVTIWYRAPELLLGDTRYTTAIDVWSVGCILIELLRMNPLFPGKDELDQLRRIFLVCGSPNSANWPSYAELPFARNLAKIDSTPRSTSVPYAEADGVVNYCQVKHLDLDAGHLASRMLELDPARRCSAAQALQSKFFIDAPDHSQIPPFDATASYHEWETKKERKAAEREREAINVEAPSQDVPGPQRSEPRSQGADPRIVRDPTSRETGMMVPNEHDALPAGDPGKGHASKDRERKRGRGRSPSVDSRDRQGHRSRRSSSPSRRKDKKERKSKKHGGGHRRSRSPSRRRS